MREIKISFDKDNKRSIATDNDNIIGVCEFIEQGENEWNIVHTEVDKAYGGQGIARKLVEQVIFEADKNNKNLVADCSYAQNVLNRRKN